jgi:ATP phosphoribosyltransferase
MIRIAIPNKGRLRDPSILLLSKAGLAIPSEPTQRGLIAESACGRFRILSVSARDVPSYVASGAADCAITGTDLVEESGLALPIRLGLGFGRARLVLAIPEASPVRRPEELEPGVRVASVYPRLTQEYFRGLAKTYRWVAVSGAVEAAPGLGIADAIVDLSETGTTLRTNGLRPLSTIYTSQAALVTAPHPAAGTRREVDELGLALESVVRASRCRYLMANVPRPLLGDLAALLPGVEGPTVLPILGRDDWVAVHAVVESEAVNGVVAMLKEGGATGILIASLERMVL